MAGNLSMFMDEKCLPLGSTLAIGQLTNLQLVQDFHEVA